MTDVEVEEVTEKSQTREWYEKLTEQVTAIDEQLDAGSEAAGIRKLTNDLVTANKAEWGAVVPSLAEELRKMEPAERAGNFYGFIREVSKLFKEEVDNWLKEQVESQPKTETPETSEAEKKSLSEARTALVKQIKMIVEMATLFNEVEADKPWPIPGRRGATGKRGKRALSLYTWQVDGVQMPSTEDSVKGVSQKLGFEKQADFSKALIAAGIKTATPEDEFSVTINGHTVTAQREDDEEDAEDDATQPTTPEEEDDE
jgi:hypothetical protein